MSDLCTPMSTEFVFVDLLRRPGIDSQIPAWRAGMTTFVKPARQATEAGGIDSSESIPGLHKRLQIRALDTCSYTVIKL
jgi:hypothetical protein